jgi:uncharacterized membrane protein
MDRLDRKIALAVVRIAAMVALFAALRFGILNAIVLFVPSWGCMAISTLLNSNPFDGARRRT